MSFSFKKQIFGFLDMLRFTKMTAKRRKLFEEAPATPIPATFAVNELAAALHPGTVSMKLTQITQNAPDVKTFRFEPLKGKPAYFRAGQYVTVTADIDGSKVTRPYSLSSSPKEASEEGFYTVTIKRSGILTDYMLDKAAVGDLFLIGEPGGEFHFQRLRDNKQVVAVAGGSGITPFYSMAKAIADGTEDFSMTLFYGAKNEKELAFRKELDAMAGDRIKVVYVLSEQKKKGFESGFVTKALIEKYVSGPFTLFACGPNAMYDLLKSELKDMKIKDKHFEANCVGDRPGKGKTYELTVRIRDEVFHMPANDSETLLVAMERAGIEVPSRCRAGGCGYCHSKLVNGKFSIAGDDKRRLADVKFGYVHPCCTYPDSDLELIVPHV